ncbi:MAG: translation initiation factor IF-3 [bacterium]
MWRNAIKEDIRTNQQIRTREVRLITSDNQQIGVVPIADALRMAQEAELDLVEVAPNAKPPVCKIVDFRKIIYEQKRRARESKKKQKTIEVKEIKMRPAIYKHDYQTKINHARVFLGDGHKVKITFMYKGREHTHPELAQRLLNQVLKDLEDVAVQEIINRMGSRLNGCLLVKKR